MPLEIVGETIILAAMPDTELPGPDPQRARGGPEPLGAVSRGVEMLARQTFAVVGLSLIAISIPIGLVTPFLPIGLPMAILGVVVLGRSTQWGRNWMSSILDRYPRLERLAPNWLMKQVFGREKRR